MLGALGFYTLAGQPESSRDLLAEVRDAEAMGLGTAFVSERYDLGCDRVILHGATPEQLRPIVDAYRAP